MRAREKRHASTSRSRRAGRILGWVADVLVVLLVVAATGQVQFDLGHRWFGLTSTDSGTEPGQLGGPPGLKLTSGRPAELVAAALVPGTVSAAAVQAALAPYDTAADLGKHLVLEVADLSTGQVVFRRGAKTITPASTMKLLTATATLQMLGPMARFKTTVVGTGNKIVLVGGGDPFLASTPARGAGRYPVRADITTLAQRTAAALKTAGISKVAVGYDASLFTGPAVNSHWPATYISQDVVPPISALWVDEGRGHNGYYVSDPALAAAQTFVAALKAQHIAVSGVPRKQKAPAPAAELAEVESSPVGEIIQQTLALSDNNAAEVLARHVGRVVEHDASFAGGAKGTFAVLTKLGVDLTGSAVYDGSGLSRQTRLTPTALMDVVKAVTSAQHPTLREVITGLPVAGFTGSLKRRFGTGLAAARGRVLAKTGTLTGVHGLVGVAADLDGDLIAFVFVVDRIPLVDNLAAQHQLDVMAGALGACHCGQ